MERAHRKPKSHRPLLWLLVLGLIATTVYALQQLRHTSEIYDGVLSDLATQQVVAKETSVNGKQITIPTYEIFKSGNIWMLVSKKQPLEGEAGFELKNITVAHGDAGQQMKVAAEIINPLEQLVNAAEADGEDLMISSAYRSLAEQQKTLDAFIEENGQALASLYVSPVGASEHHTGLSVDFSSASEFCEDNSNDCSLSQSAAAWLAQNATKYGFIQRYPANKQSITGVAFEPWHFRYVGRPLASAMAGSGLSYEEVLQQIAPGYSTLK